MSSKPIGPVRRAWYRWKALKLPWRKRFLVGLDLNGNTFWEFHDALGNPGSTRMRRIIQFQGRGADRGAGGTHLSDVAGQISPAWHQWLRHTRQYPPTLTEQSQDLVRQERLKILAAQADARWEAKARIGSTPNLRQALPAMQMGVGTTSEVREDGRRQNVTRNDERLDADAPPQPSPVIVGNEEAQVEAQLSESQSQSQRPATRTEDGRRGSEPKQYKEDPWKKARSGPSEEWQPKAWDPSAAVTRRA